MTLKSLARSAAILLAFATVTAQAADVDPKRTQRAEELLRAMKVEDVTRAGMMLGIDQEIQNNPQIAPFREVILEWAGKFMSWKELGPKLIELYATTFTEKELAVLIKFYESPTGKKALAEMPTLMQKGVDIGREIAEQHQGELQEMIRTHSLKLAEEAAKKDAAEAPPAPAPGAADTPPPPAPK
jgi:hypothetical protein